MEYSRTFSAVPGNFRRKTKQFLTNPIVLFGDTINLYSVLVQIAGRFSGWPIKNEGLNIGGMPLFHWLIDLNIFSKDSSCNALEKLIIRDPSRNIYGIILDHFCNSRTRFIFKRPCS